VCNYNLASGISPGAISSLAVDVNYRGPSVGSQVWTWEVLDTTTGVWVSLGDNTFASGWVWTKHTFAFPAPLARYFTAGGLLPSRPRTDSRPPPSRRQA